jgi:hypothetical protein
MILIVQPNLTRVYSILGNSCKIRWKTYKEPVVLELGPIDPCFELDSLSSVFLHRPVTVRRFCSCSAGITESFFKLRDIL